MIRRESRTREIKAIAKIQPRFLVRLSQIIVLEYFGRSLDGFRKGGDQRERRKYLGKLEACW